MLEKKQRITFVFLPFGTTNLLVLLDQTLAPDFTLLECSVEECS